MSIKQFFAIILSGCLVLGCASSKKTEAAATQVDPADSALAEAATSVSGSLVELAQTASASNPVTFAPSPDPISYGMGAHVSINWSGPVEPLIQSIATQVNYKLRVKGQAPAIPVLVTLSAKNEVIGDILSNAAYQCGERADIVVYPDIKTIELRYTGN